MKTFLLRCATVGITCFLASMSCKKTDEIPSVPCSSPTKDATIASKLVVGSWQWVSEYVYDWDSSKYVTRTPAKTGYRQTLIFQNDNNLFYYRNDSLIYKAQYSFITLNTLTNQPADTAYKIIRIVNSVSIHEKPLYLVCNDSLTLNYLYYSDYYGFQKWVKK